MRSTVLIGDVADIQRGSIDPRKYPDTHFELYSIPGFDDNRTPERLVGAGIGSTKSVLPEKGVLFSKLNPRINRVWTFGGTSPARRIASTEFVCLVPDEDKLDLEYLGWRLRAPDIVQELPVATAAATKSRERIKPRSLLDLTIPLPPLKEQQRIVGILNQAAKIQRLRLQAQEHFREFIPALFARMFGEQDQVGVRYPCVPLREVAEIGSGATKGRRIEATDAIEVPYLRVANVQDGFLNLDEIKTITIRRGEERKYSLAPGDLVMTEGGDPDKLGRAAVWNGELGYCAHQNHVFRVRPDTEVVLTDYLRDVAGSVYGKAYFLSVAKQTTGIARINKTQLGGFPVPVPPMELQVLYAKIVATAHEIASVSEAAAGRIATLSSSLFSRLLESPTLGKQIRSTSAGSHTQHTVVQP